MSSRHQEASLYYYIEILLKRKRMILLFVSLSLVAIAVVTMMTPKTYRGRAMLFYKQHADGWLSLVDVKNIINDIYDRKQEVFVGFSDAVTGLGADIIGDTSGKLYMTIEAMDPRHIRLVYERVVEYVNDVILDQENGTDKYRRRRLKKELLEKELEFLRRKEAHALKETKRIAGLLALLGDYDHMTIEAGVKREVGLNGYYAVRNSAPPVRRYYFDLIRDKFKYEEMVVDYGKKVEALQSKLEMHTVGGLEPLVIIGSPAVDDRPVRPRIKEALILGGLVSLVAGIFLAFLAEYIERYQVAGDMLRAKK